jgi:hypothetical protein
MYRRAFMKCTEGQFSWWNGKNNSSVDEMDRRAVMNAQNCSEINRKQL